jgi:hypothetical protein
MAGRARMLPKKYPDGLASKAIFLFSPGFSPVDTAAVRANRFNGLP